MSRDRAFGEPLEQGMAVDGVARASPQAAKRVKSRRRQTSRCVSGCWR